MLDVRLRTKPIADLLQVSGSGREQAPRRVQFRWGTLIFNGVITTHQEVFDYFSPSGVPLRSKVQLTLTEQEFRYQVDAADAARRREATAQAATDARTSATAAGADSLLGGAPGSDLAAGLELSVDLRLDADLSVQLGLAASLGVSADLGLAAGAGIPLDASAAVDVEIASAARSARPFASRRCFSGRRSASFCESGLVPIRAPSALLQ